MKKIAEYIQRIEIDSLWSGRRHIVWDLKRDVNILSGVNGVGKSTILNRVIKQLLEYRDLEKHLDGVTITYSPEDCDTIRFDVIRSFDRAVISSELLSKVSDREALLEAGFAQVCAVTPSTMPLEQALRPEVAQRNIAEAVWQCDVMKKW